ncbi:MAG: tetratricopeptide repeat protein [Planctomycetota bacterium]|jgi:outer membrane protein assembly factor BamD (BamD/ComL family)
MFGNNIRLMTIIMLVSSVTLVVFGAETWRLEQGRDWSAISEGSRAGYVLAVSEIKGLVQEGRTEAVKKALAALKKDFPEVAGPDLDVFMEAEVLFSEGKFTKAVRAYDRLLTEYPSSRLYEAALEREFAIATGFLGGEKKQVLKFFKIRGYSEGEKVMGRIVDRAGDVPIGVRASVAVAESLEKRGKFEDAYQKWSEISSRWPTGRTGRDSLLGMARCKHAAYRGPNYSISNLISAKSYYKNFKQRYPREAESFDIAGKLRQIEEQQAYKQFSTGEYYKKAGNDESARFYYEMVLEGWPESVAAKMAKEAMSGGDAE